MRMRMTMVGLLVAGLAASVGCAGKSKTAGGPTRLVIVTPAGESTPRNISYDLENSSKLVLLGKGVEQSVSYPSVLERVLDDGRLEVIVNVKNRLNRRIEVQISCVFKDETGFPSNDESPFRTLILTEHAEEGARFVSLNDQARTYTIQIREAR